MRRLHAFFLATLLLLVSTPAFALKLIPAKTLFTATVPSPTLITYCQQRLWVLNHEKKTFAVLDAGTGRAIYEFPVTGLQFQQVSAAACFREHLLLAFVTDRQKNLSSLGLFEITGHPQLSLFKKLQPPAKGRIQDLHCADSTCLALIDGEVYRATGDLSKWEHLKVPRSPDIKSSQTDLEANPFDDWQDQLMLSHGRYAQVLGRSGTKDFYMLDPLRASVVSSTGGVFDKWGHWGAWEGYLMSPKALAILPGRRLVVSDTTLKALLVFSEQGQYLGAVSNGSSLLSVGYGIKVITHDDRVYVSDFEDGKVLALELPGQAAPEKETGDFTRANFFRRPEVLQDRVKNRCLACHDGTVTDELDKYAHAHANHPVNLALKKPVDLFTGPDQTLTCATCHNPHHGAALKENSRDLLAPDHPPFLRKDFVPLCLSCHEDKVIKGNNHPEKGDTCMKCHVAHGGTGKLLTHSTPELCVTCHKDQRFSHRPVADLLNIERAKTMRFENNQISCLTCHSPHSHEQNKKLLRASSEVAPFCASCHGDRAGTLFESFHTRMKGRR